MDKWILFLSLVGLFACNIEQPSLGLEPKQPNVVIIFTDDQGYEDLGCFGSPKIKTPNLDQLAKEGFRFSNFYVTASVCSPSRASLLTGRYPDRNGVGGVFFPDHKGMDASERTIAELLKEVGYQTACFGKWHLGDLQGSLPTDQGFDEYIGIPYSNDMYIGKSHLFADQVAFREGYTLQQAKSDQAFVAENSKERKKIAKKGIKELVPLFRNDRIIEYPCDQATLTKRYFQWAIDFIERSDDRPFFLYLAPAMPHIPLFASDQFRNTSDRGLYGDVIEEIDWWTGQLMRHIQEKELDQNTLVIFTSDNGPWLSFKEKGGSAGQLRGGKFSNYEGGVRVPCIMRWPGMWRENVESNAITSTVDLFPTLAHYAGVNFPKDSIDGINLASYLEGKEKNAPREEVFYTKRKSIVGIRKRNWKFLPNGGTRFANTDSLPELYNLEKDPSETINLYQEQPEVVERLFKEIKKRRGKRID